MNKKLYVGNLPFAAEEAQLQALFGADGRNVVSVKILMDRETGRSRGFCFVEMATADDAAKAMQAMNGHEFMGRALQVTVAREQEARPAGGGFGGRGGGRRDGGGRDDGRR